MQQFHIIDALGPFVTGNNHATINWSKVDFSSLETNGRLSVATRRRVIARFARYAQKVAELGYDSISIDDLAHLTVFDFYSLKLQTLLQDYRGLYAELFIIANQFGLKVFINTDYLFFNEDIHRYLKQKRITPLAFYQSVLKQVFTDFPDAAGIILRIGENDGKDVRGTFRSQLLLKTPAQAKRLLLTTLPLFEAYNKKLIFRTWTVGVYKIGDLIWNKKTYDAVFGSVKSDSLIISMKFGDTDFMRYLPLNPLFSDTRHHRILELQTRREWEGMGEFPSFIGWDYQKYLRQLSDNPSIVGIHVWCQTGGWAKKAWSTVTYLDKKSFWNELNTEVAIGITKHKLSVEDAVRQFCLTQQIEDTNSFIQLLRLADTAILKGLYFPEAAKTPLYFRRTRIPPLTWLTWDKVHLPPIVKQLHKLLIPAPKVTLQDADAAVEAAEQMILVAKHLSLPSYVIDSLVFEHQTLRIFAQLKRYAFNLLTDSQITAVNKQISAYQKHFSQHYTIPLLSPPNRQHKAPRFLGKTFIREVATYRKRDKLLLATSPLQARFVRLYLRRSKSHLADQSMGFEVFFK